jgi:hypothetical protein
MKAKKSTSNVSQPDFGTHMARPVGIVDLGHQPGFEWNGKEIKSAYKLRLTYELPNSTMEDGRPHWVHEDVTNSDNEKSTLAARVRSLGGDFSNLTGMLGNPCMVTLVEGKNGYAKIDGQGGVGGVPAGMPVPELVNDTFTLDLENPDLDVYESLPEFIQERIKENLDFENSKLEAMLNNPEY